MAKPRPHHVVHRETDLRIPNATPEDVARAVMRGGCSATCYGGSGRCQCREADARRVLRSPPGEERPQVWSGV